MRALTGEWLLTAWDQGTAEDDLNRALTLLRAALPGKSRAQLAELPLAHRNCELLRLHLLTFGPHLRGFALCGQCGAQLEFALPASGMLARLESQLPECSAEWFENGSRYRLRPVNTGDLLAALAAADPGEAQERVWARCSDRAPQSGAALRQFEQLNASAELVCAVECPECSVSQALDFDIARFLWQEVRHWAVRLVSDIHQLASAYGWSEESIARMSPRRRETYLEMLSA